MTPPTQSHPRRLGLALSGGGFRASLFHVGVLARLAELDLLREVEVISTVSGGSIIGALYYLHVRNLLEATSDTAITRQHYVDLVARLADEFQAGVRRNLRMRAFAEPRKVLRSLYDPAYSRSDRMAELYEEFFYAGVAGVTLPKRVELPSLRIKPPDAKPGFNPLARADMRAPHSADNPTANDDRGAKVPILVINATTLNTGHLFQFTATWLGEPDPPPALGDYDRNLRLNASYYRDLGRKYQHLPLGVAVAASAAVPGIFPPLALTELYADADGPITPQLVDGGVHDNQGINGLLNPEAPCTHLIISDASGQMEDLVDPATRVGAVAARSNAVLMDRVREAELSIARLLESAGVVEDVIFFHLKEGMQQRRLSAGRNGAVGRTEEVSDVFAHGVDARVQEALARLRTDLDAFTDVEAHALMADGYLIAKQHLDDAYPRRLGRAAASVQTEPWSFRDIEPLLRNPDRDPTFLHQLEVGARVFGKSIALVPCLARWSAWMRRGAVLVGLVAVLFLAAGAAGLWHVPESLRAMLVGGGLAAAALLVAAVATSGACVLAIAAHWGWGERRLRRVAASYPGWPLAALAAVAIDRHTKVFDALRLEAGQVSRLVGRAPSGRPVG
jgi:NTE family protein